MSYSPGCVPAGQELVQFLLTWGCFCHCMFLNPAIFDDPSEPINNGDMYGSMDESVSLNVALAQNENDNTGIWTDIFPPDSLNPPSDGNGGSPSGPITCNFNLYGIAEECAKAIEVGIYIISCSNYAMVSFLPVLGMEHSIKKMLQESTISTVSFYGFRIAETDTSKAVGLLCTVPVKFDPDVGTPKRILIDGTCTLRVNGLEAEDGIHYTTNTPGFTTVSFPPKPQH